MNKHMHTHTHAHTHTQNLALIAENFLSTTASQLTYHGLCELNSAVADGQICVFFRNNHFSAMYKRKVSTFKVKVHVLHTCTCMLHVIRNACLF